MHESLTPTELALLALWDAVYQLPNKTEAQFDIQRKVAPEVAKLKARLEKKKEEEQTT